MEGATKSHGLFCNPVVPLCYGKETFTLTIGSVVPHGSFIKALSTLPLILHSHPYKHWLRWMLDLNSDGSSRWVRGGVQPAGPDWGNCWLFSIFSWSGDALWCEITASSVSCECWWFQGRAKRHAVYKFICLDRCSMLPKRGEGWWGEGSVRT